MLRGPDCGADLILTSQLRFEHALQERLANARRGGDHLSMHLIRLDCTDAGQPSLADYDSLLPNLLYKRLTDCVRETDVVAALDRHKFAVLQSVRDDASANSVLAAKLVGELSRPVELPGATITTQPGVGIAVAPRDGATVTQLLASAEVALARACARGGNTYEFFGDGVDDAANARRADAAALHQAIREQRFHLTYQPKVIPATGETVAVEVLLRCDHPALAHRPIPEVIALARRCGQIHPLSEWVLVQASRQAAQWVASGHSQLKVCVNLCAPELSAPGLLACIDTILAETGLPPAVLMIELSEQDLFESAEQGIRVLRALKERGLGLALDDFGTGYSSLSYLTSLPIDVVKLDIAFVRRLPDDDKACTMVRAIIDLAHALELLVIAEGVETREQLAYLESHGCDEVQGYYFSEPVVAEEIEAWLSGAGHSRAMST